MINLLLVALGGGAGAFCRFSFTEFMKKRVKFKFPFATLTINVLGSFLLGLLAGAGELTSLLLGVGFMGGFTTFSTFQMENIRFAERKQYKFMAFYVLVSCILGIGAAYLGIILMK